MSTHTQVVVTHAPEETAAVAARVVSQLTHGPEIRGTSTILALEGDLGAGKTVFAKGAAEALGVQEMVTSPTYVIQKIYSLPEGAPWKRLVHIDAYRLLGEEELHTIAWDAIATDPGNLILVEWPEQVGLAMPERAYRIQFEEVDEMTRRITLDSRFKM